MASRLLTVVAPVLVLLALVVVVLPAARGAGDGERVSLQPELSLREGSIKFYDTEVAYYLVDAPSPKGWAAARPQRPPAAPTHLRSGFGRREPPSGCLPAPRRASGHPDGSIPARRKVLG